MLHVVNILTCPNSFTALSRTDFPKCTECELVQDAYGVRLQ